MPAEPARSGKPRPSGAKPLIALVVSQDHEGHRVRDRGYAEVPARIPTIAAGLKSTGLFEPVRPRSFPEKHLREVHDPAFVAYLKRTCAALKEGETLYPYLLPVRNRNRLPSDPAALAGYYCIDTFTPLHRHAYEAARRAAGCALTAAQQLLAGRRLAYALVRPPGHHAERRCFGGFCYLNNAAIAAHHLSPHGRVAVLDLDYHHGNGTQDIFYERADVLTVSIHGHPRFAYPHFSGFDDERGAGPGEGYNVNLPLPERCDGRRYRTALAKALQAVEEFRPQFLVVALGFDPARRDPAGTWSLGPADFRKNGEMVGRVPAPILLVQEGGYRRATLGANARSFFQGLMEGASATPHPRPAARPTLEGLTYRYDARPDDVARVREIVDGTHRFRPDEVVVATELVEDRLEEGPASGYEFIFAEANGRTVGYTCYGPIACTVSSYDLYWIAVDPTLQGHGIGQALMEETERLVRAAGGSRIYIETSNRPHYAATRAFYERCGYKLASLLEDFYAPGDAKATYCKTL